MADGSEALADDPSGAGFADGERVMVRPAEFAPLGSAGPLPAPNRNLGLLLDVSLEVVAELGRTSMAIKDVLNLVPGSIVELDKIAGEPVNLLVNGVLLARGEVVVVDEQFGIRISEIVPTSGRIDLVG